MTNTDLLPPLPERVPQTLQELDPLSARLALDIEKQCAEAGFKLRGVQLLIGLSGGTDSLALTVLLAALRQRCDLRLAACHLDHGLRPGARLEQNWVNGFCQRLGIDFFPRVADVRGLAATRKTGLEEAGRAARYAAFQQITDCLGSDALVLGHTLDDLGEDVFMRLLRGCGWPALGGMRQYDAERALLRPLLYTERAALTALLQRLNLPHLEDESNSSDEFLRNRVRKLLTGLKQENPGLPRHVEKLNRLAAYDDAYWAAQLDALPMEISNGRVRLDRAKLKDQPKALRLRLYMRCIRHLGKGQALFDNLLNIDATCLAYSLKATTHKVIELPQGIRVIIDGPDILFTFPAPE